MQSGNGLHNVEGLFLGLKIYKGVFDMTIKNRESLVNELAKILMQFDKDCNQYQTDVYFYYDRTQIGSLHTFTNVGGNSWLDDDHITIYTDKEHYDDGAYSWIQNEYEMADILGIDIEQLVKEAKEYGKYEEDEEIPYNEIKRYVQSVDNYNDVLWKAYYESLKDYAAEYYQRAEEMISSLEAIPYFTNEWDDSRLIDYVAGSNADVRKLNDYAEKYSTEHEVSIEELRDMLIEKGILEYNGYFGGYKVNVKAVESEV